MKIFKATFIFPIVFVALALTFYSGHLFSEHREKRARDFASDQVANSIKEGVSAFGTLEPLGDVHILAGPMNELGGAPRIQRILVSEGEPVKKGQKLVIFDNTERLSADKNKLLREISAKRAEIQILQTNIERFAPLSAEGSFPLSDYEDKKVRLATFQSQLEQLLGSLRATDARIDSDTAIKSPISGFVLRVNSRPGERSGSNGVIEIGNIRTMQAVVQVDEGDIRLIKVGQQSIIKSENGSFDGTLKGTVSFVGLSVASRRRFSNNPSVDADPEKRVIDVRILLDPPSSNRINRLTGAKVSAFIEL